MYAFVDRPVAALPPGGKFALWAMRGWLHAASKGVCPPGQLAPAFARHGVLPALPHVHRLLAEINRRGRETIAFAPLDHALVTDDEAVMLQLWRDAGGNPPRAQETLSLLLEAEAVGSAFAALLAGAARLSAQGLGVLAPEDVTASPND